MKKQTIIITVVVNKCKIYATQNSLWSIIEQRDFTFNWGIEPCGSRVRKKNCLKSFSYSFPGTVTSRVWTFMFAASSHPRIFRYPRIGKRAGERGLIAVDGIFGPNWRSRSTLSSVFFASCRFLSSSRWSCPRLSRRSLSPARWCCRWWSGAWCWRRSPASPWSRTPSASGRRRLTGR